MTRSNTLVGLALLLASVAIVGLVTVLVLDPSRGAADGAGDGTQPGTKALVAGPRSGAQGGKLPVAPAPEAPPATSARPEARRLVPGIPDAPRLGPDTFIVRVLDDETERPVTAFSVDVLPHVPGDTSPEALRRRLTATPDRNTRPFKVVSGVFRLDGKPGTWDLIVEAPGYQLAALPGFVLPARDHLPRTLRLGRGPGIAGHVFTLDGAPASDIEVHLHVSHLAPDAVRPASLLQRTDESGRFHFSPLPAGVYSVALHERDNMQDRYAGIRIEPGITVNIEMVMQARMDAIIEVREVTGRTVAGAEVSLVSLDQGGRGLVTRDSDSGGRATLRWLRAGRYRVTARHPDFREAEIVLDLQPGAGLQFQTIQLQREDG